MGECLYCTAVESAAQAPPSPSPAAGPPSASDQDRAFGLLLFEAEECLARGNVEKAAVLASRAVRERPDSLTARALSSARAASCLRAAAARSWRQRVQEAQGLLDRGELDGGREDRHLGAEAAARPRGRPGALRRAQGAPPGVGLGGGGGGARAASGWPGCGRGGARRPPARPSRRDGSAARSARSARAAPRPRRSRAARAPDACRPPGPSSTARPPSAARCRRRCASVSTCWRTAACEQSLAVLRAVLREDPENARAQAAVQDVRHAWLARAEAAPATPPDAPPPPPPPVPVTARPPSRHLAARRATRTRAAPSRSIRPRARDRAPSTRADPARSPARSCCRAPGDARRPCASSSSAAPACSS